jgi:hypothetical protein
MSEVRNWLGRYFLLTTVCLGTYILLFAETRLLPISSGDSLDAFQIVVPVLVAQLTTVFSWFTGPSKVASDTIVEIPSWIVKAPPLLVVSMVVVAVLSLIVSTSQGGTGWIDASKFKSIVTFSVTVLNATSVILVARVFGQSKLATQ